MKKEYDEEYVNELQKKISELETELRGWHVNGIWVDIDAKMALFAKERDEEKAQMDERERIEEEKIDSILVDLGF